MRAFFPILFFPFLGLISCKNASTPAPNASVDESKGSILAHRYWVNKSFHDALMSADVVDTLSYLPCAELIFTNGDSLFYTYCLSDAGMGTFKTLSPTSLELTMEGFEGEIFGLDLDAQTGILHLNPPKGMGEGWPREFVAVDGLKSEDAYNSTIALARKRLAGSYTMVPAPGEMAMTALIELREDGTHAGLGDFDTFEPWPSGISGALLQGNGGPLNLMYLNKKGSDEGVGVLGWQVRGDTLRLFDTKNTSPEGDMPEYVVTKLRGTLVRAK